MSYEGAIITVRSRLPETARDPAAVRAFCRSMIDAMNRASDALECGGAALTEAGFNAATGDVMLRGLATLGRRAVVDDIKAIGRDAI